jgi:hypothetical protein
VGILVKSSGSGWSSEARGDLEGTSNVRHLMGIEGKDYVCEEGRNVAESR